jgi:hypothetical protein
MTENKTVTAHFTQNPLTVDYIRITFKTKNEILDNTNVSTNFTFKLYASAFNDTYGFVDYIEGIWNVTNNGSNASINATQGKIIKFSSGTYNGTAIVTVDDGNGHTDSVDLTINSTLLSMVLYEGWNLITIPFENDWTAETLGKNITGCNLVLRFNGSRQEFETHVVGVPYDDFPIQDGKGYFVRVPSDRIFSCKGLSIPSVNVTVYDGWNTLGWFHDYPSSAQSLGENVSASLALMFNARRQEFMTYVMNSGYDNFVIMRGMGVFIRTSTQSYWHGEG